MSCPECFSGFNRTDKTPTGTVTTAYGVKSYLATPPSTPKGIVVIVPDAFGWEFTNNRLLADTYAEAGFRVYLPDFMEGRPAPLYFLDLMPRFTSWRSAWDVACKPYDLFWLVVGMVPFAWSNLPGTSHPRITKFLEQVKTNPVAEDTGLRTGVAGFCWGGKHVIMLAHKHEAHLADAVFTAHPSMLALPADIEKVTMPVSIAIGDKDEWFKGEQLKQVEKMLEALDRDSKIGKSEVVVYPGAGHGFSVRIDVKNPKQVEQSQEAERQAINWFEKKLA